MSQTLTYIFAWLCKLAAIVVGEIVAIGLMFGILFWLAFIGCQAVYLGDWTGVMVLVCVLIVCMACFGWVLLDDPGGER